MKPQAHSPAAMTRKKGERLTRRERERLTRKKEIIDAAQGLFFSKGFENTTMDEIADRAEFGKPTLYTYFKSKEEIAFHVHLRGYRERVKRLQEAAHSGKNGYEKFRAMGHAYFEFYKDYPEYLRIQVEWDSRGYDFDRLSEAVREGYGEWHSSFRDICEIYLEGVADGSLRADLDVEKTVDLFFMSLRAAANQILLIEHPVISPSGDLCEALYFDCLKILMRGLGTGTRK